MNFDEINEKLQKNQGIILTKLLISQLIAALSNIIGLKIMLGQSTHILWADMDTNLLEYS